MNKECIVLVGLQGCGKSTFIKTLIKRNPSKHYTIISQDEQGKKQHIINFETALSNNENVIIDRINHTSQQRKRYISQARENEYSIIIYNLNITIKECVKRLLSRKNHPSFLPKNHVEAIKVLQQTLKEYETPVESECDYLYNPTQFDPYCLDLSESYSQFIIIGDIHGCFDELQILLSKPQIQEMYNESSTALICVGDLVDKGPKSREVLEWFFSSSKHYCVRGNHEYKLLRYLKGNPVTMSHGLQETVEQCDFDINSKFYDSHFALKTLEELESLPFMIKIAENNYVLHAGVNPNVNILRQPKEYLLFARNYNPITHSFNTQGDKFWFEYYNKEQPTIYFGHHYQPKIQPQENIINLDGYCVYGYELRTALVHTKNKKMISRKFLQTPALNTHYKNLNNLNHQGFISHLQDLEQKGYIKSSVYNDLILFNYTQKCVYDKFWNSYTMQARGIVFNKKTGDIIARPFGKFFNINENSMTQLHKLPNEEFEIFEKVDGVLGILFFYNNKWIITTRGEFNSKQAKIGEELLESIHLSVLNSNYTYLCEIVDTRCEIMIKYNTKPHLILVGAIKTKTGSELNFNELSEISSKANFESMKKMNLQSSLQEIINESYKWVANFEGVVIRFNSGLRVKVKSQAYIDVLKVKERLNSTALLNYIDTNGNYSLDKLRGLDEEVINDIQKELESSSLQYKQILHEIEQEANFLLNKLSIINSPLSSNDFKKIGLALNDNACCYNYKHKSIIIAYLKTHTYKIHDYIVSIISFQINKKKNNK